MKYYKTYYNSPVGKLILISDGSSLVALYFNETEGRGVERSDGLGIFLKTKGWLDRYFKGEKPLIGELSLSPKGTLFREEVWNILSTIPYGETVTYKEIAERVRKKSKMSAQAVGGAVGHNPIPIIIPCHRVIGSDSSMVGYVSGIERKVWLLKHEGVDIE